MRKSKNKIAFIVLITLTSVLTSCWNNYSAGSIGTQYGLNTDLETDLLCDIIDSLYISDFSEISLKAQAEVQDWHKIDSSYVFLEYKDNSGVLLMFKPGNYIWITRAFNLNSSDSEIDIDLKYSKVIEEAYCQLKKSNKPKDLFYWKTNRVWYIIEDGDTTLRYENEINCNL